MNEQQQLLARLRGLADQADADIESWSRCLLSERKHIASAMLKVLPIPLHGKADRGERQKLSEAEEDVAMMGLWLFLEVVSRVNQEYSIQGLTNGQR